MKWGDFWNLQKYLIKEKYTNQAIYTSEIILYENIALQILLITALSQQL